LYVSVHELAEAEYIQDNSNPDEDEPLLAWDVDLVVVAVVLAASK
jgi:hypothetical protein